RQDRRLTQIHLRRQRNGDANAQQGEQRTGRQAETGCLGLLASQSDQRRADHRVVKKPRHYRKCHIPRKTSGNRQSPDGGRVEKNRKPGSVKGGTYFSEYLWQIAALGK